MKDNKDKNIKKIQRMSRAMFWGSIFLMLSPGIQTSEKSNLLFRILLFGGIALFGLNWIIPVLLLILKKQVYAFAWSRGLEKWERVKDIETKGVTLAEKILIYMKCILALVMYAMFSYLFAYIFLNSSK